MTLLVDLLVVAMALGTVLVIAAGAGRPIQGGGETPDPPPSALADALSHQPGN